MEPVREQIKSVPVRGEGTKYLLTLDREDFSAIYPRMIRYVLAVREGDHIRAVFRTNSFEYSPLSPLAAETAARDKAGEWEQELATDPSGVFRNYPAEPARRLHEPLE